MVIVRIVTLLVTLLTIINLNNKFNGCFYYSIWQLTAKESQLLDLVSTMLRPTLHAKRGHFSCMAQSC